MGMREDRLAVAKLSGIASRYALGNAGIDGEAVRMALDNHRDGDPLAGLVAEAVAEIHAVSTDARVLSQAAAPYTDDDPTSPRNPYVARLLELAGADLEQARGWRAAHPARGFNPPQASPERDRKG
jgi:hypothetical protein